jgi:hypothetical protein
VSQYQSSRYRFDRQATNDFPVTSRSVYGNLHHMTSSFYGGGDDESRSLFPINGLTGQPVDSSSEFPLDGGAFSMMTSPNGIRQGMFYRRSEPNVAAIELPMHCSSSAASTDIKKEPRDISYDVSGRTACILQLITSFTHFVSHQTLGNIVDLLARCTPMPLNAELQQ